MIYEEWKIHDGRLKFGRWTLADLRYSTTTPDRKALITSAPQMLEVLEALEAVELNGQIPVWLLDRIQVVLKKARHLQ